MRIGQGREWYKAFIKQFPLRGAISMLCGIGGGLRNSGLADSRFMHPGATRQSTSIAHVACKAHNAVVAHMYAFCGVTTWHKHGLRRK